MSVSAKQVKELRDATGVGMMDCKEALQETDGDFDEAVSLLRKKGQEVASDRAAAEADEGLVVTAVSGDGHAGAIVEINCETDFVARNDDFQSFAETVAERVLAERPADLDALEALSYEDDVTVEDEIVALTRRIAASTFSKATAGRLSPTSIQARASACSWRCTGTGTLRTRGVTWPCRWRPWSRSP